MSAMAAKDVAGHHLGGVVRVNSSIDNVEVQGILTAVRHERDRIDVSTGGVDQWLPGLLVAVVLEFGDVIVHCHPDDEVTLS